jgi:putative protein-disulfide isomerase
MQKNLFSYLLAVMCFSGLACSAQEGCPAKKVAIKPSTRTANLMRNALIGKAFPEIKAKTLAKKEIILPKEMVGKPTVICVAFDGSVQNLIDTWAAPILAKYPDGAVNYYEIPMINWGYKFARGMIDGGMRGGVPEKLHNNVATYYGSLGGYKKTLLMDDTKTCYLFLLDKTGVIQYVADNAADAEKLTALYAAIEQINNPQLAALMPKKDTITYVFDPLCGFCYAFEPEMKKLEAKYKDKFVFEIISGGMVLGKQEGAISVVAPHIAGGYKDLEKLSSARFGDAFLTKIMKPGTYKMSSEMPSIALEVFKSMQPENAIAFANDVQIMLYYEGISLNEAANYAPLATKYGLNGKEFVQKINQSEWKTRTYAQFAEAEKMEISGFPAVVLKQNNKIQVLYSGFETFENMAKNYPFQ